MPDNNISQLVGERITVNSRNVQVIKQLGEGGFSFVYLVKEEPSASSSSAGDGGSASQQQSLSASAEMVLKITSIHSRQQRDIAEKEAKRGTEKDRRENDNGTPADDEVTRLIAARVKARIEKKQEEIGTDTDAGLAGGTTLIGECAAKRFHFFEQPGKISKTVKSKNSI